MSVEFATLDYPSIILAVSRTWGPRRTVRLITCGRSRNANPIQRFRDDKFHLPTDYNTKNARNNNGNIINVTGDEHMDMILDQMEKVNYDKYHKPNPGTNLDVSVNMFIDTIQGTI